MERGARCGVCCAGRAPFCCPRCLLRYCSAPCFSRHGPCARLFQRRQQQLQLQSLRGGPGERRRLEEALLRLREADDEEPPEPCARLWERLGPEQRRGFQRLLSSGGASALLPPWRPWWEGGGAGAALVQELQESPPGRPQESPPGPLQPQESPPGPLQPQDGPPSPLQPQDGPQSPLQPQDGPPSPLHPGGPSSAVPRVPTPIPPLGSLTGTPTSPLVRFQVPNVLFAYAYATALYQGEGGQAELLPEFCGTVLDVSGALGARQVFQSTAEALQAALQALAAAQYPECSLGNAGVMLAVAQILLGARPAQQKGYSLAALAHLSRLLGRARRQVPSEDQPRVHRAQKKCDFLLSWVNEHEEALMPLALEVQQEHKAHLDAAKEVGAVAQEFEKMWGAKVPPPRKPLIEELD